MSLTTLLFFSPSLLFNVNKPFMISLSAGRRDENFYGLEQQLMPAQPPATLRRIARNDSY